MPKTLSASVACVLVKPPSNMVCRLLKGFVMTVCVCVLVKPPSNMVCRLLKGFVMTIIDNILAVSGVSTDILAVLEHIG